MGCQPLLFIMGRKGITPFLPQQIQKSMDRYCRMPSTKLGPLAAPQLKSQYHIQDLTSILPESIRNLISYMLLTQV